MNAPETRPDAVLGDAPTQDIATIEKAAESLTRCRDMENAIALWALALRLRAEARNAVT